MYEEPYRWIEAVNNRRQYLDDQLKQGSPIVALSYADGILLLTVSRGTPKLYEIYDRLALGGMGHPADLEKLRFHLLDMAHLEGFNRSPADVTGPRLLKNGLAPTIKQAFEEIFKAPFIAKLLLAELGSSKERDQFLSVDYDGTFDEASTCLAVAGTPSIQATLVEYMHTQIGKTLPALKEAVHIALQTWAMGDLLHHNIPTEQNTKEEGGGTLATPVSAEQFRDEDIHNHLRQKFPQYTLECTLLDRTLPGVSKYRVLSPEEMTDLLPSAIQLTA